MSSTRRFWVVVGSAGFLSGLALLQLAYGQIRVKQVQFQGQQVQVFVGGPGQPPAATFSSAVRFPKDSKAQQAIRSAADLIQDQNWPKACEALQFLLGRPEDGFIQVTRDGGQGNTITVSIRHEANRLIGSMPKDGLEIYQALYGARAKIDLDDAKARGDAQQLAEVALRFLHTKAGGEAVELLGTRCLERDEPMYAALWFERLLGRPGADDLGPRVFFKAALAFTRAGDQFASQAAEVWKKLENKSRRDGGVRIGDEIVRLDRVRAEFDQLVRDEPCSLRDYLYYRGSPDRTSQGIGGHPFMEPTWQFSTLPRADNADGQRSLQLVNPLLNQAVTDLGREFKQPLLPSFFPIVVNGKLVCRTYDGLQLLDLKQEGKPDWWAHLDGGPRMLLADTNRRTLVEQWAAAYRQGGPKTILFENSVIGTLSTDGTRVFAVDDLILPPRGDINQFQPGFGNQGQFFGPLADLVNHNTLKAYNVESGKLVWELGGKSDNSNKFKDTFFLGAPLPLFGKLYVLYEQQGELRLACLEPKDTLDESRPPGIVWTQRLATTKDKIQFDLNRRIHAAHLSYSDGILVCPTNAGAVIGVELLSHSLVWAYPYRESNEQAKGQDKNPIAPGLMWINRRRMLDIGPPRALNNEWRVSAPAIHDGKVVFTAPDGKSIHCVNLKDGQRKWIRGREEDDLYFAGIIHGKALIVGKNHIRALHLANGEEVWKKIDNTGLPSGQGVASDNIYYLPIQANAESKEPEVLAIDVDRGIVLAHTKSRRRDGKMEVPGNLIFHDGQVISQNLTEIKSYPQLQVKLAEIDRLLSKNPRDARGLAERGELRLDKGELQGASEDFHQALAVLAEAPTEESAPLLAKTHSKLYECLTEMLQREFSRGERYLEEYKELCQTASPAETIKRQGNFYCLLAKGRENQGRLREAFDAYLAFAGLGKSNDLVTVIDQPNTKSCREVWSRGRIAAMTARATAEQRRPLEERIADQWRALQNSDNLNELRKFVSLFGAAFQVGKVAKLRLAEKLLAENKEESFREAQLLLLPLRSLRASDPQLAGRAVEALARLMIRKGAFDHAAHYYHELGRDFAGVPIRDGKTGGDFYRELATDKRFLPFLDGRSALWNGRFSRGEHLPGSSRYRQLLTMEPVGDVLPFFQHHRFVLEAPNPQSSHLCILDPDTGAARYQSANLPAAQFLFQNGYQNRRMTYHLQGHVATFQLGHMVYCFDAVDQKKLWEFNLYAPGQATAPQNQMVDPADGWVKEVFPQDNFKRRIGQLGPVQPSYVCMQTPKGLVAVDPLKGTTLWIKEGVSLRTELFGDDNHVYLVDVNAQGLAVSANRAVRAADGVMVSVPDFTKAYQNKLQVLGRQLFVKDEGPQRQLVLRLYDVHSGKDVWQRTYPADSIALKPDQPRFGGAIEPDGALTVFDLQTQKEVLKTTLNRKDVLQRRGLDIAKALDKVSDAHLLFDRDLFYVALSKPAENGVNGGAVWVNAHMLRCLPVNGMMYAFNRHPGAKPAKVLRWAELVPNQMLVMEQFQELPLLLFTSRYMKPVANAPARFGMQQLQATRTMQKRTGLLLYDKETVNNGTPFHAVEMNAKDGTIDFVNFGFRIRHKVQTVAAAR